MNVPHKLVYAYLFTLAAGACLGLDPLTAKIGVAVGYGLLAACEDC